MDAADLLLGPRARRSILAKTLLDPGREFHLRELARLTDLSPRTVQSELDRLVKADLLSERRSGNRRYVRANPRHPLFGPVREIVVRTIGLADELRKALGTEEVQFALVHGSIASATPTAGSDIDLLIVGTMGLREATRRLRTAHDVLGREIVPIVWTPAEFEGRRKEGDAFLMRILERPTIPVVGSVPERDG